MTKKAVALLSGGMDSVIAAATVSREGYDIYALTMDYGQRHLRELACARELAKWLKVRRHEIIALPISGLLSSALTSSEDDVTASEEQMGRSIPPTYVPGRNTVFLSIAIAWAESIGADAIVIGANSIDYSGYPDCRPAFIEAFQRLIAVGTKAGIEGHAIEILAPLISMSKADIVRRGMELGVPFEETWSCYRGGERPCGRCEACLLRKRGFETVGIADPAE